MNKGEGRKPGFNIHGDDAFKKWQDLILSEGVEASVVVMPHIISIRTESYRDFLIAKSVVGKRTGLEVVRG